MSCASSSLVSFAKALSDNDGSEANKIRAISGGEWLASVEDWQFHLALVRHNPRRQFEGQRFLIDSLQEVTFELAMDFYGGTDNGIRSRVPFLV